MGLSIVSIDRGRLEDTTSGSGISPSRKRYSVVHRDTEQVRTLVDVEVEYPGIDGSETPAYYVWTDLPQEELGEVPEDWVEKGSASPFPKQGRLDTVVPGVLSKMGFEEDVEQLLYDIKQEMLTFAYSNSPEYS